MRSFLSAEKYCQPSSSGLSAPGTFRRRLIQRLTEQASRVVPRSEILTVTHVAAFLQCSVDAARRIPRAELPARQGPGKVLLYLREDVISYVMRLPVRGRRTVKVVAPVATSTVVTLDQSSRMERVRKRLGPNR
jgi:hypothetical protein